MAKKAELGGKGLAELDWEETVGVGVGVGEESGQGRARKKKDRR